MSAIVNADNNNDNIFDDDLEYLLQIENEEATAAAEENCDELEQLIRIATESEEQEKCADKLKPTEIIEQSVNFVKEDKRIFSGYAEELDKQLKARTAANYEARVEREVSAYLKEQGLVEASTGGTPADVRQSKERISRINASTVKVKPAPPLPVVAAPTAAEAIYTDPVFHLRIVNPLISSTMLRERISGRQTVHFAQLAAFLQRADLSKDWVLAGVIASKSTRQTKAGKAFSSWRITDLSYDIPFVTLMLFDAAHKDLWKLVEGTCIAVLNPSVSDHHSNADLACISINTSQKVMVLGQSKDLGVCKARKKNGDKCTAVVNLHKCDTCKYHMTTEYQKLSRRSEFQSTSGGGLPDLRSKILGKSENFYGYGNRPLDKTNAIPAKKSSKLLEQDKLRMSALADSANDEYSLKESKRRVAASVASTCASPSPQTNALKTTTQISTKTPKATKKASSILTAAVKLQKTGTTTPSSSTPTPTQTTAQTPTQLATSTAIRPQLSRGSFSFEVSINSSVSSKPSPMRINERQAAVAKQKAVALLKQKPIEKLDPNSLRGTRDGKRRAIDALNEQFQDYEAKRQKMSEQERHDEHKSRIQRIMDASSSHTNLIDMRHNATQAEYFNNMERKETLEERMVNTKQMEVKAVSCKQCKYTALSAAEKCKAERHVLKVVNAIKSFYACDDCGNRTISLDRMPKHSCSNCKGSKWKRTGMMRERKICQPGDALSLRGDEETFIGTAMSANLNLLVPESGTE